MAYERWGDQPQGDQPAFSDSAGGAEPTITAADAGRLDQIIGELPAARQLAIGRALLANPQVNVTPAVRGPLAAIRNGLAVVHSPDPAINSLLTNVRTAIDQEIGRIDGRLPNAGLAGHPDYGVIGSILEHLTLLESCRAI